MICLGGKVSYYHRHDASQAGRFLGRDHHDHRHHHYTGIIWVGVWVSIFFSFYGATTPKDYIDTRISD